MSEILLKNLIFILFVTMLQPNNIKLTISTKNILEHESTSYDLAVIYVLKVFQGVKKGQNKC